MSKRPPLDLMALTSEQATPMSEAVQRIPAREKKAKSPPIHKTRPARVKTENLQSLAFKVSPVFRKRFRQRAVTADLKLNELLFEALYAWEKLNGLKK